MKIALVHDFLKEYGGAERVLETLHEIWPKAPIYTAFIDRKGLGPHADRIKNWQIKTSFAQKIPFISKLYSPLRFLAPLFFASFDFSDFDVVISSTNAYYAKGILTKPETIHICYCHTPPRSLYGYQTRMNWQENFFTNIYGQIINYFLRKYDFLVSQRVNYFIANSQVVRVRIKKFYRRDSEVIYPPVELKRIKELRNKGIKESDKYYLYVGKLAAAKNVNLAIEAALKMGFKLKVVGKGGEEESLKQLISNYSSTRQQAGRSLQRSSSRQVRLGSNNNVEFLGEISDERLVELYTNCKAVIFPAVDEDFGIVPVEAMSFGKPVIAYKSGGVVETVIDGKTGALFDKPTVESLTLAIKQLNNLKVKPSDCINQAGKFSKEAFKRNMVEFVKRVIKKNPQA
ncbi:glycosyltransferase [Candidatus Gottesmanbacteria bacterium]|nr:glycosyltransferase [Candidatus Gottesmanbacteria bacterium]